MDIADGHWMDNGEQVAKWTIYLEFGNSPSWRWCQSAWTAAAATPGRSRPEWRTRSPCAPQTPARPRALLRAGSAPERNRQQIERHPAWTVCTLVCVVPAASFSERYLSACYPNPAWKLLFKVVKTLLYDQYLLGAYNK